MSTLIESARTLQRIDENTLKAYRAKRYEFLEKINDRIVNHPDFERLKGNTQLLSVYDNNRYHLSFMSIMLMTGHYDTLATILIRYYRTFHNQGVEYDYFKIESECWIDVITEVLPEEYRKEILDVYRWIYDVSDALILEAKAFEGCEVDTDEENIAAQEYLLSLLIEGNMQAVQLFFEENVSNWSECESFFIKVIHPTMVRVGLEWENGHIPMAVEHLATSIIYNLLSTFYFNIDLPPDEKGVALVTAAPNEFHEMGAWMVASALEMDGWRVTFLGSNTSKNDIVDLIKSLQPDFVAISVGMAINLEALIDIIDLIKSDSMLKSMKIMIGGQAFMHDPTLIEVVNVDAFLRNGHEAVLKAREWQIK